MSHSKDAQPPPLAYATPERPGPSRTREVVLATITLVIGIGLLLAAAAVLVTVVVALPALRVGPELFMLGVPVLYAFAMAYAGVCVTRASLKLIGRPSERLDRLMNNRADLTPGGCAVLIVAVPVLTASCAVLVIGLIHLGGWVRAGFKGDLSTIAAMIVGPLAAIGACVLVMRLRV